MTCADPRIDVLGLLATCAWAADERRFEDLAECFTADATYVSEVTGRPRADPVHGRDAIVARFREIKQSQDDQRRHVLSNPRFTFDGDGAAEVRSYVTVSAVAADGTLTVVTCGQYHDRVTAHDGVWRIAEKHLLLDKPFLPAAHR